LIKFGSNVELLAKIENCPDKLCATAGKLNLKLKNEDAGVAQLVEQLICNQ